MKRIILSAIVLAGLAGIGLSCQKSGGEEKEKETAPTAKSEAVVSFVSRLSDATLYSSEADFEAIRNYAGGLESSNISYLYLDRADGDGLVYTHKIALKYSRWATFSLYKMNSVNDFSGGYSIYRRPTRRSFFYRLADDSFVTGVVSDCSGALKKLDADGKVTSSTEVDEVTLNYCTAAFTSESQIDSFLETNGAFESLKADVKNFLIIGTVKNSVYAALESKVKAADSTFNVEKIAEGSTQTLCFIASRRYWQYNSVEKKNITSNGIDAYEINITWK